MSNTAYPQRSPIEQDTEDFFAPRPGDESYQGNTTFTEPTTDRRGFNNFVALGTARTALTTATNIAGAVCATLGLTSNGNVANAQAPVTPRDIELLKDKSKRLSEIAARAVEAADQARKDYNTTAREADTTFFLQGGKKKVLIRAKAELSKIQDEIDRLEKIQQDVADLADISRERFRKNIELNGVAAGDTAKRDRLLKEIELLDKRITTARAARPTINKKLHDERDNETAKDKEITDLELEITQLGIKHGKQKALADAKEQAFIKAEKFALQKETDAAESKVLLDNYLVNQKQGKQIDRNTAEIDKLKLQYLRLAQDLDAVILETLDLSFKYNTQVKTLSNLMAEVNAIRCSRKINAHCVVRLHKLHQNICRYKKGPRGTCRIHRAPHVTNVHYQINGPTFLNPRVSQQYRYRTYHDR